MTNKEISENILLKLLDQLFKQIKESNDRNAEIIHEINKAVNLLTDAEKDSQRDSKDMIKSIEDLNKRVETLCGSVKDTSTSLDFEKEYKTDLIKKIDKVDDKIDDVGDKINKLGNKIKIITVVITLLFSLLSFTYVFVKSSMESNLKETIEIEINEQFEKIGQ